MKKVSIEEVPIVDLNLSAFLVLHGLTPKLLMQGTLVKFIFPASNTLKELCTRYNNNEPVPIIDFVTCQRKLREDMLNFRNMRDIIKET